MPHIDQGRLREVLIAGLFELQVTFGRFRMSVRLNNLLRQLIAS